jgi:hypothetical protein
LIGYATINFNRIRDALRLAFGGDYQTGVITVNFVAVAIVNTNFVFPRAFTQATGPQVIVTAIDNLALPGLYTHTTRATPAGFIFDTIAPFAINGAATVRWVAFYP